MIVGDTHIFAIESHISCAYERISFRALGFFLIHLESMSYGVRTTDATLLACSFDQVSKRLRCRGMHKAFFSTNPDAGLIADTICSAVYASEEKGSFLGMNRAKFLELLHSSGVIWAPDGDAAFDDGSHVLHLDVNNQVRLIGFRQGEGYFHDPASLRDIWLDAGHFYHILSSWRMKFEAEWVAAPKVAEQDMP